MEDFECFTSFEYKGIVKRKICHICYIIGNFFIHEIVLVFLIELKAYSHSLTSFQIPLVSTLCGMFGFGS